MDTLSFFSGMKAFAAFLQVWNTRRDKAVAISAYREAKVEAEADPEVQESARRLAASIENHPVLGKIIQNRFGRCEDEFEAAWREADESVLEFAAVAYKRCKCLIMKTIAVADGKLSDSLQSHWDQLQCDVVLDGKKP